MSSSLTPVSPLHGFQGVHWSRLAPNLGFETVVSR